MKEELRSSETSVLTRVTRRIIPEGTILHVRRNLLSLAFVCSLIERILVRYERERETAKLKKKRNVQTNAAN
jgi:hypothetical protein